MNNMCRNLFMKSMLVYCEKRAEQQAKDRVWQKWPLLYVSLKSVVHDLYDTWLWQKWQLPYISWIV